MSDQSPSDTPAPRRPTTRRHRRAVWLTIVATQLVVALATVSVAYFVHKGWNDNIAPGETIEHKVEKTLPAGVSKKAEDQPLNILVMGSDTRVGKGNGIDGENRDGSQRSDTVILLHVSQDRSHAYGVSLPRDAIIDRPDCKIDGENVPGEDGVRFNTAFQVGGAQCTVQTVEALTGVYIDHFLVLDFNGFKDMVDAVDGVEVCIPEEVDDPKHDIYLDAGTQVLTGQDALNYVRERYVLSVTGDIGRMKRQQAFIASMINKVFSADVLSQPGKVNAFLNAVTSSIQVDDKLDSVGKLFDLAMEFRDTGLDKIKFITVPIAPDPANPMVTLVWTDAADKLWQRIIDDEQLGKDFTEGSIAADSGVGTEKTDDDDKKTKQDDAADRAAAGLCV
ncbi:LCP family protein [Nocardioides marinquilinus]|uniref:LCP family protein n=1 Tax=Nocardioides marinquilinus TaxID=1210400 RepID=A0ABP9PQI0_9ACTN